jgi:hypothetical protein
MIGYDGFIRIHHEGSMRLHLAPASRFDVAPFQAAPRRRAWSGLGPNCPLPLLARGQVMKPWLRFHWFAAW